MKEDINEKREFKRTFFTVEDGMVGTFTFPGIQKEALTAYIFNLSIGGIFFTIRNDQNGKLKEGNHLIFMEIKQWTSLKTLVNIDAKIKWIRKDPLSQKVGIGCEFLNIPDTSKKQIRKFID